MMNEYEYKGMACQTFRLEGVIKNNERLANIMQNMHRVMFLDEELEIIKEREKGKL